MISGDSLPTAQGDPSSVTWTFTLTNATLDDVGMANDSMTWDMTMEGDANEGVTTDIRASIVANPPVSTAHWIMGPDDAVRITASRGGVDYGQRLTFRPGPVSYSLNGGSNVGTGSFRGFVSGLAANHAGTSTIGGETVSGGAQTVIFSTRPTELVVDSLPSGRFRFGNVSFQVTTEGGAPPKPEGMLLLAR